MEKKKYTKVEVRLVPLETTSELLQHSGADAKIGVDPKNEDGFNTEGAAKQGSILSLGAEARRGTPTGFNWK